MKTRFNITVFEPSTIITELVMAAALSNGHENKMTLEELEKCFEDKIKNLCDKPKFEKEEITYKATISGNSLLIDRTVLPINKTSCLCEIEEVELTELVGMDEETENLIYKINNSDPKDDIKDIL